MASPVRIPRPEHPRPQMVRDAWLNLNGEWDFEFDPGKSGRARKMYEGRDFSRKILVPFCPESKLSGIEYKDFLPAVWYRREFTLPEGWRGRRVLIHFGAVDYEAEVWINGVSAGTHRGGYTPFSFDVTPLLKPGVNVIVVCAEDDVRTGLQPGGKQSDRYHSYGCLYTRTTGIWQTVWLECVPETYLAGLKLIPDPQNACVHLQAAIEGPADGCGLEAVASFAGKEEGRGTAKIAGKTVCLSLPLNEVHLWEPGKPRLYDLSITVHKGDSTKDKVTSYFGLRSVSWRDHAVLINDEPVFQRLVLDQGFYPDGIYTAPTEADLRKDIEIAMGLGFNGARLHQKLFEPRFLYWADKLGYLVWGEYASWRLDISTPMGLERFLPEWLEALARDFNHPSLVGWCPFNETNDRQDNDVLRAVYQTTKAIDPTRPVIDTSGYVHVVTDIYDVHDYNQNPASFKARYEPLTAGGEAFRHFPQVEKYEGQPYFVSEYGGIWWNPGQKDDHAWGYGDRPISEKEFLQRYEGLTMALLDHPKMCAFCYTQLYDVEQEVNGLYTYDRKPKFDPALIRAINTRPAAIEKR